MIVVSNTSPLTSLASIGLFDILPELFGALHVAEGVIGELNAGGRPYPGSREVAAAKFIHRHRIADQPLVRILLRDLDRGEAETLALAVEIGADLVLMDEREGRKAAKRLGFEPMGILGILAVAKRRALIPEIRPALDDLRRLAGFYIGDELYRSVLEDAGE